MTNSPRPAAIFDVDDTLCDTSAMKDGVQRPIAEWNARFLAAQAKAEIVAEAMALVASGIEIVLVTARGEAIAEDTKAQVESFGIPVAAVYARRDGDNRVDWKVKTEALAQFLADGFTPVVAFDDKPRNLQVFENVCETRLVA